MGKRADGARRREGGGWFARWGIRSWEYFVRVYLFPLASLSGMNIRKARDGREDSSSKGEVRNFENSQCERAV